MVYEMCEFWAQLMEMSRENEMQCLCGGGAYGMAA